MLPRSGMVQNVGPGVAIAGALTRDDLADLRRRGYTAVLDLRLRDEPVTSGLSPAEEEVEAGKAGLAYRRIEVSAQALEDRVVDRVREALAVSPGPVVVHCASGRRAAVLTTLDRGCREGWTPEQCLARLRELGHDCEPAPALRDLLVSYLSRHRAAGRRHASAVEHRGGASESVR